MIYELPRRDTQSDPQPTPPALTPAERALLLAAGPTYIETAEFDTPDSDLASNVEPDDWRIFFLMRELPEPDRAQILAFAELLFNLRHAQRWAAGDSEATAQ